MRFGVSLFAVGALAATSPALPDTEFDVPNGRFRAIQSGDLTEGTLISCLFTIEEAYFGPRWIPMVSISFSGLDEPEGDGSFVKIAASRSTGDVGWKHELTIHHENDRVSRINALTWPSESPMPMTMYLDDDDFLLYFTGDDADSLSKVDVSFYEFSQWDVNVSGVSGSANCKHRLLDDDKPERLANEAEESPD